MDIQKAYWNTDGNSVRVTMPLTKVDKENRIVSGYATLDNVDTSDDVVLASASKAAFDGFRGNIRLMHQPIPAGKLVDFREESFYDTKSQKFYNGIWVDVYVSKGAPAVWEMVLDGTLTGFSIGGQIRDAEPQFVKDAGKTIRFIKAYDLIELSLVDSPANQLCDIISITKAADGSTQVSGMLSEVIAENVFWCAKDEIAYVSSAAEKTCTACDGSTDNIGWFESDGGDKTEKVNALVAEFTKADSVEGRVNNMADDITVGEEVEVEGQTEPTPLVIDGEGPTTQSGEALGDDTEGDREDALEDAAELKEELDDLDGEDGPADEDEVSELAGDSDDEEDDVEKAANADDSDEDSSEEEDDSNDSEDDVKKSFEVIEDALVKFSDRLSAIEAVTSKVEELTATLAELTEKVSGVSNSVDSVKKSYDAVEKNVGFKKSGDLGGSKEEVLEKSRASKWGGRFFGSVDNLG